MRSAYHQSASRSELDELVTLVSDAALSQKSAILLLERLNFITTKQAWIESTYTIVDRFRFVLNPFVVAMIDIALAAAISRATSQGYSNFYQIASFILLLSGVIVGYHRWARAELNRGIDDAMTRREKSLTFLRDNASIIVPVLSSYKNYGPQALTIRDAEKSLRFDLFVTYELDSLEYYYRKSRLSLITPEATFQSVQTFLELASPDYFSSRASRALEMGRYDVSFTHVANRLLDIAHYIRQFGTKPVSL